MSTFARVALTLLLIVPLGASAQPGRRTPTIDQLLELRSASNPQISPDGRWVAFLASETDWQRDEFVSQLWLVSADGGEPRQLTRGEKGVSQPGWSPDGRWISFVSSRADKPQLYAIRPDGGEAVQLSQSDQGVQRYAWAPDGRTMAFVAAPALTPAAKERTASMSEFTIVRRDYDYAQLWTFDVAQAMRAPVAGNARTRGTAMTVDEIAWSPDGATIAFSARRNPDLIQGETSDLYAITLASDSTRRIVGQPGSDGNPVWSPDGKWIAFSSRMGKPAVTNGRIAIVASEGGTPRSVTDAFDENASPLAWTTNGIWFNASQRSASQLFRVEPSTNRITRVSGPDGAMVSDVSITRDGRAAFIHSTSTALPEVAVTSQASWSPRVLTSLSSQIRDWNVGTREIVSWTSKDGATIEGVLIKPTDFDPSKKYPLLVKIHGGPTGTDRPALFGGDHRTYPVDLWVNRGALVLKVNYRGSAGYGEKFRMLNIRNLGVGDAWDILSGVDYLIAKGWVDSKRVASMGWSQGGYISAFLTTTSDRFVAISVGAGISDWATYYYNTDITTFTINYLGADPVADPEVYRKTSPVSYMTTARTPTLIQHGELDRRVPIANAYQLRQALEDRGVPVEMVVYKGFGHGITKPKAQRAAMTHNLLWFNHYIFGDPSLDLAAPPAKQVSTTLP